MCADDADAQPASSSVQALRPNRTRRTRSRADHAPSQNAIASESPGSIHAHADSLRVSAPRRATTVNPPSASSWASAARNARA